MSAGEFVIRADSVQKVGVDVLNHINEGKFAEGGLVQHLAGGGEVNENDRRWMHTLENVDEIMQFGSPEEKAALWAPPRKGHAGQVPGFGSLAGNPGANETTGYVWHFANGGLVGDDGKIHFKGLLGDAIAKRFADGGVVEGSGEPIDWKQLKSKSLLQHYADGGWVENGQDISPSRFDDYRHGMADSRSASMPPNISSDSMGSSQAETVNLNLMTPHGTFPTIAAKDVVEALRSSAIGQKLTSTGSKPSWWS